MLFRSENLGLFSRLLRGHGMVVTVAEEVDAAAALLHIDLCDPEEFYWALRSVLVVHPKDGTLFDTLFWGFWTGQATGSPEKGPEGGSNTVGVRSLRGGLPAAALGEDGADDDGGSTPADETLLLGYSPEALLRKKSFEEMSPADLEEMEKLLTRMVLKLPTRRSRRLIPSPRRNLVDLRRSFRATLRYGEIGRAHV